MKTIFPRAHIESIYHWEKWIIYLKEDGVWMEYGDMPKGAGKITGDRLRAMSSYEIDMKYPLHAKNLNITRNNIIAHERKMEFLQNVREKKDTKPEIIYICGTSGVGKTRLAYDRAVKMFKNEDIGLVSFANGFFTGVDMDSPCLIVDEFRDSQINVADLLRFMDRYICNINVKGGNMIIKPKCIIFSSIKRIEDLYKEHKEMNVQFRRRVTEYVCLGGYVEEEEKKDVVKVI